jgi:hypothetical protein
MGNLIKSQRQPIYANEGNGFAIFLDGETSVLMLKDVRGNIQPLSDFINGGGGGSVGTLQQVTDNGNTTTNDIKVSKLYLKDSASELNGRLYLDSNNWFFEDSDGVVRFIATEGSIFLKNRTSEKEAVINTNLLTANRTYTLPDTSGTIAVTSDIPTELSELNDDSTHRLVTDTQISTWDGKQNTLTETNFGSFINGLTAKNTLVDADEVVSDDSADSNKAKKTSWLNVWNNYLKPKADALYQSILTDINFGTFSTALTPKTTPVDADTFNISNSTDSNKAYKVSWLNIKATLKSYFDTLYATPALIVKRILNNTVETTPLTGTTSETLIYSAPVIAAGTFTTNDYFNFQLTFRKSADGGVGCTYRVYVSNTNNFASASLLATWASQRQTTVIERKNIYFKADNTINSPFPVATSTQTDLTNLNNAITSISLNPANDIYVFVSAQLGISSENVRMTAIKIFN